MLRERGVVGKFVEFFGPGLHTLGLADRATIGNMSPEFEVDLRDLPGRPGDPALPRVHRSSYLELIESVDAYAREQGMFHEPDSEEPTFSGCH